MSSGYYCLGNGYPDIDSDGQTDCHDLYQGSPTINHPSSTLNTELKKVGSLPQGTRTPAADGYIVVMQIFDGDKCPTDMKIEYDYNTQTPNPTSGITCSFVTVPY